MTRKQKGLTLIEAVIGIGVSGLIGALLISLLTQNNGLFSQQNAKINQGLSLNNASIEISDAIKSSASVASSTTQGGTTYNSGQNTLILTIPALDATNTVIANVYDYMVITKDSQNPLILRKYLFPDPASIRKSENKILTTRLSLVQFYYYNLTGGIVSPSLAEKVNYVINESEKAGYGDVQSSVSGQINLRNN